MKKLAFWDAHGCFPLRKTAELDDLKRYKESGVGFLSINIGMDFNPLPEIIEVLAGFRAFISENDEYELVGTAAELERARADGKMAIAFDLEGSVMLQDNVKMVSFFYDLGVRQMLLAYNNDNSIAGGCTGDGRGISELGKLVIGEMNRVGMTLDVSHMSPRASLEALEASEKPAIFSHSNAKALCDHPRNITDDQIKACAAQGGVVGVNGIGIFLNPEVDTSSDRVVEHIDHMAQLVGADHVGIGLDYVVDKSEIIEYVDKHPEVFKKVSRKRDDFLKFSRPEQLPEIPGLLSKRGYSETDVAKVMGGNFLRIAEQNWV